MLRIRHAQASGGLSAIAELVVALHDSAVAHHSVGDLTDIFLEHFNDYALYYFY